MAGFVEFPALGDALIRNASVPGCLLESAAADIVACDILVSGGIIARIGAGLEADAAVVDLGRGMAFPGLVDLHTHLDKGHIWPRAFNANGTHLAAQLAVKADREANWSATDVATRADFALRCAYAHGTVAIRTHLDSLGAQLDITWPVFRKLRDDWAGRIALQGVALIPLDAYGTDFVERMADVVADAGGILGGSGALQPDAPALIARIFELASERDLDIDLHVDETGDPDARTLGMIARETIRHGYQGRVTCGHCCSLAVQDEAFARETIALVAEAGLTVVTLPIVNLYLQGRRTPGTPVWRGITLVHELRAAGVRVVIASDNTRDPFYGFGDLDLTEVFREAVRIGHLDLPVGDWPRAITSLPAEVMKLQAGMLREGAPADLVLFSARDYSELLSRPQRDRVVLRNGLPIDTMPPHYRELDHLFEGIHVQGGTG
jgi:cytosine deaminase